MRRASGEFCSLSRPTQELPDLACRADPHLAREQYRPLVGDGAGAENAIVEVFVRRKAKHASALRVAL